MQSNTVQLGYYILSSFVNFCATKRKQDNVDNHKRYVKLWYNLERDKMLNRKLVSTYVKSFLASFFPSTKIYRRPTLPWHHFAEVSQLLLFLSPALLRSLLQFSHLMPFLLFSKKTVRGVLCDIHIWTETSRCAFILNYCSLLGKLFNPLKLVGVGMLRFA